MVRPSTVPHTPQEQIIDSSAEEEENDANEGAADSSPLPDVDTAANGKITGLGKDLPIIDDHDFIPQSSSPVKPDIANMGAEQSRQQTNAAIHGAAARLRARKSERATGNLKAPSRVSSQQRRLPIRNGQSVYDHDSPPELPPTRARTAVQRTEISPRRTKRREKAGDEAGLASLEMAGRSASLAALQSNGLLPNPYQMVQEAEAPDGAEEDEAEAANAAREDEEDDADAQEGPPASRRSARHEAPTPKKRGPGRPRKNRTIAAQKKQNTKAARKSAPQDIPPRRHGGDATEQGDEAGNAANTYEFQADDEEHWLENFAPTSPQVDVARPSGLFVEASPGLGGLEDSSEESAPKGPVREKRKRGAGGTGKANVARKIRRRGDAGITRGERDEGSRHENPEGIEDDEDSEDETNSPNANVNGGQDGDADETSDDDDNENADDVTNEADQQKLYGQWPKLRGVFSKLKDVGCHYKKGERQAPKRIKLDDKKARKILQLCKNATSCFTKLRDHPENSEDDELAGELAGIRESVGVLAGEDDNHRPDFTSQKGSDNLWFHLVPGLVRLLQHAIDCYLSIENEGMPEGQITNDRLRVVYDIIKIINTLGNALLKYWVKPTRGLGVQQAVLNGMLGPLRTVSNEFGMEFKRQQEAKGLKKAREQQAKQRARQREREAREMQEREEKEAEARARRLEREEQAERQRAHIAKYTKKWADLHVWRLEAERELNHFVRGPKQVHLQIPSHAGYEYDQNGDIFTRQAAFAPRVGPPPARVNAAAEDQWDLAELGALQDGLQQYSGSMVFENIFKNYCKVGDVLNRFNVTQIVTTAVLLKDHFGAQQRKNGGSVEDWVKAIPVWTKGLATMGKENDDTVIEL